MKVVLARSKEGMEASAREFERGGLTVLRAPVTMIAPPIRWEDVDEKLGHVNEYTAIACTSANGIAALHRRVTEAHPSLLPELARIPLYVVGKASADRAQALGLRPVLLPDVTDGASLGASMSRILLVGSRVLHARGDLADGAVYETLRAAECVVDEVVVYRTCVADADTLRSIADVCRSGHPDAVIYFSPSSVEGLELALGAPWIRDHKAVALGPRTAEALRSRSIEVAYIPERPSIDLIAAHLFTLSKSL